LAARPNTPPCWRRKARMSTTFWSTRSSTTTTCWWSTRAPRTRTTPGFSGR
jgi:hypothetical protein